MKIKKQAQVSMLPAYFSGAPGIFVTVSLSWKRRRSILTYLRELDNRSLRLAIAHYI